MTPESGITMMREYDTLRNELLEAKRHVFERPLVIAALAAAGLQFLDKPFALVLPSVVALLTIFNFWFTLNRVQSANRIVAYIQLVLEPAAKLQWIGWESSLRKYRRWLKANPDARTFIDAQLDHTAVPDALMYYPALYYFHFALMISVLLASGGLLIQQPSWWRFVFFLPTLLVAGRSLKYFTRWTPNRLRASIERNRVIWKNVLGENRIASWRQTAKVTSKTTPFRQLVGFFTKLGTGDRQADQQPMSNEVLDPQDD
jgi:hypothetical protein